MQNLKSCTHRLDYDDYEEFKEWCKIEETDVSKKLRRLIAKANIKSERDNA